MLSNEWNEMEIMKKTIRKISSKNEMKKKMNWIWCKGIRINVCSFFCLTWSIVFWGSSIIVCLCMWRPYIHIFFKFTWIEQKMRWDNKIRREFSMLIFLPWNNSQVSWCLRPPSFNMNEPDANGKVWRRCNANWIWKYNGIWCWYRKRFLLLVETAKMHKSYLFIHDDAMMIQARANFVSCVYYAATFRLLLIH